MDTTIQDRQGRVTVSVTRSQMFTGMSTTGSSPVIVERQEASVLDSTKYDIAAMVKNRMARLLVVCDMHGADLREIIGPKVANINIHDGRTVMREAILAEMNRLSRDIQKVLDAQWP